MFYYTSSHLNISFCGEGGRGGGGGGFLKKVLNYHINLNKIGSGGIAPNKKKILGNSSDGENKRFMVGNGNLNLNILFYV